MTNNNWVWDLNWAKGSEDSRHMGNRKKNHIELKNWRYSGGWVEGVSWNTTGSN